jgi:hypothetical protein
MDETTQEIFVPNLKDEENEVWRIEKFKENEENEVWRIEKSGDVLV